VIVVDASAVVDVVLDQPHKDWVPERLRGQALAAPAHQPAEVVSAIARLVRAGDLSARVAAEAVEEAVELPRELVELDGVILSRALELNERIRVLDGLYVATAETRGLSC
jgi:predicted nucleic acid-binding protein